jgi:hypothetical protein
MSKNYLIDYNFGLQCENNIINTLQNYFNDDSITKLNRYSTFDFKGNQKYIELKTRRVNYNKYPTTMIGYNKIMKALEINEDVYFIFNFTDGIYYYKFDKEYELEIKKGGRFDRGRPEINDYVYLPIELLIKID